MPSVQTNSCHLLLFPLPRHGHMIPTLDLISTLLGRRMTITVITCSPTTVKQLEPLISLYPTTLNTLKYPCPDIIECAEGVPKLTSMISATRKHEEKIIDWFKSHPFPPVALLSDCYIRWATKLADQMGIAHVKFVSSSACALSINPTLFRDVAETNARSGILVNSFEELEGAYLQDIKKQLGGHVNVWAVGKTLYGEHVSMANIQSYNGSIPLTSDDVMKWLDEKKDESVVFICFGAKASLTPNELTALVNALEFSEVNFIFCAKQNDSSNIPYGFTERVFGRGFIIRGWAPQFSILSHRAVGSFLTNCGWNSVLEGLNSGVPMLTWPRSLDQFVNSKLLVNELGVAKQACVAGGPDSVPKSKELARLLLESLDGGSPERFKVKNLSRAINERASSDLDMFLNFVTEV